MVKDLWFINQLLPLQICHPSGAAITGELIKNSQVVLLEKCGHAMTMDRPRKCAKLIQDFIHQHTITTH